MQIIIPTKGRISNQLTYENLPPELQRNTTIVCPKIEAFWHKQKRPLAQIQIQPDDEMGIAEKRKWIVDTAEDDKIIMLDDDLRFACRRDDDPGLFRAATPDDVLQMFKELKEILCEETPHAGFAVRGMSIGDSAKLGGWQKGKRSIYSLGYYLPIVKYWAELGRVKTHEDIDVTLQLLEMGFPNMINFNFVTDQKFGSVGGCTNERTIEINNADCQKLVELHPEYVTVEAKTYKNSPPRLEVRVQWIKAMQDGIVFRTEWLKAQLK